MTAFKRSFIFTFLSAFLFALAFLSGYVVRALQTASLSPFPVLFRVYDLLNREGLKETPPPPGLEYGMIRGLLQAYNDPFTVFVEPVQHELETNSLQGRFGGIGVSLGTDEAGWVVLYPFPNSPAVKAGIQEGDRLLSVESFQVSPGTPSDQIQSAIRGPVAQPVTLTIARQPDYAAFQIAIRREEIQLPSVEHRLAPGEPRLGVIKINLIAASTTGEIETAVEDLQERGAQFFVIDLRDTPGGLLAAGIDIARMFLEDGVIIQQQYRGRAMETFRVDQPGRYRDLPLAVLINGGTASAAEIIAGALQAHGRGPLVGLHSFGKDTIQLVFDLQDGSSLHITAARWQVPDLPGPLAGVGLQPDIIVEQQADAVGVDPALQAAARYLLPAH